MNATFSRHALLQATQAELYQAGHDFQAAGINSDTRTIQPGDVFLPIVGERFNGHHFLSSLVNADLAGCFAQADHREQVPAGLPNVLVVESTTQAYLDIARYHRQRIDPVMIGITGSSGKTTTKSFFFSAFSGLRRTQCTQKNFNNDFGVSQTLLDLKPETELAIIEMAMRGPGEISRLTLAALPDIAVITNVGPAHIERLGSLEAIAQAKCEIVKGLDLKTGIMVANEDDTLLMTTLKSVWPGRLETFSLKQASTVEPTSDHGISFGYKGRQINLSVPGQHMVMNALSALKVADLLGFDEEAVIAGLEAYRPIDGRWEKTLLAGHPDTWIIQDAYNANPDSMRASLAAFMSMPVISGKALILSGMNELGLFSTYYHHALAEWLCEQSGLTWLLLIGEDCRVIADVLIAKASYPVYWVSDTVSARSWFWEQSLAGLTILLKGSRSYQLEQVLSPLP